MQQDSSRKRQSETGHDPGNFFAQKSDAPEIEPHPHETVQQLKDELRRANEHIYELYQRIKDKEHH
jgi:hypothetical protein